MLRPYGFEHRTAAANEPIAKEGASNRKRSAWLANAALLGLPSLDHAECVR